MCADKFISEEINYLNNLELIFVFSTRSWDTFKNKYNPTIITDLRNRKVPLNDKVANAHSYLHQVNINGKDIYVIPMVHMSPISFNTLIGDSYFEYLEEGIKHFCDYYKNNKNI